MIKIIYTLDGRIIRISSIREFMHEKLHENYN